jgi:hypothetical protein
MTFFSLVEDRVVIVGQQVCTGGESFLAVTGMVTVLSEAVQASLLHFEYHTLPLRYSCYYSNFVAIAPKIALVVFQEIFRNANH